MREYIKPKFGEKLSLVRIVEYVQKWNGLTYIAIDIFKLKQML